MLKTKKIKVGGQTYKIAKDSNMYAENNYLGVCFKDQSLINYSDKHSDDVIADTVLHEVLHAIWHNYIGADGEADEEKAVTMLTHGLIQVMRDNPKFIDEIRSMI